MADFSQDIQRCCFYKVPLIKQFLEGSNRFWNVETKKNKETLFMS